jgi:hypothetical protein
MIRRRSKVTRLPRASRIACVVPLRPPVQSFRAHSRHSRTPVCTCTNLHLLAPGCTNLRQKNYFSDLGCNTPSKHPNRCTVLHCVAACCTVLRTKFFHAQVQHWPLVRGTIGRCTEGYGSLRKATEACGRSKKCSTATLRPKL